MSINLHTSISNNLIFALALSLFPLSTFAIGSSPNAITAQTKNSPVNPINSQANNQPINQIVAIVNNGVITQNQLNTAVNLEKMQADTAGIAPPDDLSLERQALQNLITQTAALQMASRNNITVSDKDITAAIQGILEKTGRTQDQLTTYLSKFDLTEKNYREFVQNQLIIRSLAEQAIASNIMVTPDEVNTYIAQEKQIKPSDVTYHVAHILIALPENPTPADIQKAKAKATDISEEIKKGLDFGSAAMKYSASGDAATGGDLGDEPLNMLPTIFLGPVQSLKPGQVSAPFQSASGFHLIKLISMKSATAIHHDVTQYQIKQIVIHTSPILSSDQAETILNHLKIALSNGQSFDLLARENSQDAISASKGGLLDWASLNELGPYYASMINQLKPGEVSQPFSIKDGWAIIQLIASRQHDDSADFARQEATNAIFQKKAMEAVNTWEAELRGESYVKILLPELNT